QEEFNNQVMIYNNLYSLDTLPKQSWYFFVLAGFFIWVFSSIWLLTIFFSNKRAVLFKTRLKLARIPIFIFIYGYALWIFSMYVA
ncbi:MAG: hypothetical protein LBF38_04660, partial [Deltaproteobacteria bacterium]|nr:hypothetical protein [Deltaproteobacteria bacterium]